ncbi:hypothetical protein PUMCH_002239 [Australozyma saopauloensis]|uniref:Rhodanese domain-containing protein n=1 Tax=Australozyma saopauloensis TaxID=291208 RepID=A0AAX4H8N8_9ASCO|nr:hypothetical protein PUMCH_002239 [[Candida] saopauloensis]
MFAFRSSVARAAVVRPATILKSAAIARSFSAVSKVSALNPNVPRIAVTSGLKSFSSQRFYSVLNHAEAKAYKYEDIKNIVAAPSESTLLVDVREPAEFAEGHIPGAVNVPFKSSPGAFGLSAEEFQESFGFAKPEKETELVFYCLGGVRSTAAEELADSFGYAKRGNYAGSYEDWVSHENAAKA